MLWLSLYFPALPLDVFTRGAAEHGPMAVYEIQAQRSRIILCNAAAKASGITPGMASSAASALCAELKLFQRNQQAEEQTLREIAVWAGQFTPNVSLLFPTVLLLEIEGSLAYFGGLPTLLRRLRGAGAELGLALRIGVAPTPLGSALFARHRQPPLTHRDEFRRVLQALPLAALDLPADALTGLRQLGLRLIGECLNLPRAGLIRRFGPQLPDYFDRLLGDQPDPRPPFIAPPEFHARLELPSEVDDKEALLFAANRLIQQLAGFLAARTAATQQPVFRLHGPRGVCELAVRLISPNRNAAHFLRLLRERLEHTELSEPVRAISLTVTDIQPLARSSHALFSEAAQNPVQAIEPLLERLTARLGTSSVQGLGTRADHRPEQASRAVAPASTSMSRRLPPRPLWLLPAPQILTMQDDATYFNGSLQLLRGPERIESGWWDQDLTRDYYVAKKSDGARLWVFRERKSGLWYWHGVFA